MAIDPNTQQQIIQIINDDEINTQSNYSSSITLDPNINYNSNPNLIISGAKKKDPVYVYINANNQTDYSITSNAVKLIPRMLNYGGYMKLYTEVNSNLKIGDRIFLLYDPSTITGSTSIILDSYLLYTGYTDIVDYVKSTHGYRVIDLDNKNNAVIIEKKYLKDYDGKTLDSHYITKTYIKDILINGGYVDGAVIKHCKLNYDNDAIIDIQIIQSVMLSGVSYYTYVDEKYNNRYLGLRNKYEVDLDTDEYTIDTYITKDNNTYGYNYSHYIKYSGSTIENGNYYNCQFSGCTIYYGYYENCNLYNSEIIDGYFKNSVLSSNCKWTGGTWYEDLYTGYTYSGTTGFGPPTWNTGIWNLGNFVNKNNDGWITGIFNSGRFINSDWYDGIFNNGDMINSNWYNGTCNGGNMDSIVWYNGIHNNGTMTGCVWSGGTHNNGTMMYSYWSGGTFKNGSMITCKWINGDFYNGYMDLTDNNEDSVYGPSTFWMNGNVYGGIIDGKISGTTVYVGEPFKWLDGNVYGGIMRNINIRNINFYNGKVYNSSFGISSTSGNINIYNGYFDGGYIECDDSKSLNIERGVFVNFYFYTYDESLSIVKSATFTNCVFGLNSESEFSVDSNLITIETCEFNSGQFGYPGSNGSWYEGNWYYGTFYGNWYGGTFYNGIFRGTWYGGRWISGSFEGTWTSPAPQSIINTSKNYTSYTINSTIKNNTSSNNNLNARL